MEYRWVMVAVVCAACDGPRNPATPVPVEPAVAAPPASATVGCMTQLMIGSGRVTYSDAGVTRSVPFRSGDWPEFPEAPPFDGTCAAAIWADDTILFQDLIFVMDAAIERGVIDVYFGELSDPEPSPAQRGAGRRAPTKDRLLTAPVLTMKPTEASLNGEVIGSVENPGLEALVAAKLPPEPADPIIILQGDKSLRFGAIKRAIKGMEKAGYTDLRIATKNRDP